MKKLKQFSALGVGLICLTIHACQEDIPEVKPVLPCTIQFLTGTQIVPERYVTRITVVLDRPAPKTGFVTLTPGLIDTGDQRFKTNPPVIDGKITLTIGSGKMSTELEVTAVDNDMTEGSTSIMFSLSGESEGFKLGAQKSHILTISDDDQPFAPGCITPRPVGKISHPGQVASAFHLNGKLYFSVHNNQWDPNGPEPTVYDRTTVYDIATRSWSDLSKPLGNIQIGGKIFRWLNAEEIELYDAQSNSFSVISLEQARVSPTIAIDGKKLIVAGGRNPSTNAIRKSIEIYNTTTGSWTTVKFDEARIGMSAASVGDKLFFAGGSIERPDSLIQQCYDDDYYTIQTCVFVPAVVNSKRVDIYDASLNSWSVAQLSVGRVMPMTEVINGKVLFIGGSGPGTVDIYDSDLNTWLKAKPYAPINSRGHVVGSKILFATPTTVEIYDASANSWSSKAFGPYNAGRNDKLITVTDDQKVILFTVFDEYYNSKNVDIYDAITGSWCHSVWNRSLVQPGIVAVGNEVYVAGGATHPLGNTRGLVDDVVVFTIP